MGIRSTARIKIVKSGTGSIPVVFVSPLSKSKFVFAPEESLLVISQNTQITKSGVGIYDFGQDIRDGLKDFSKILANLVRTNHIESEAENSVVGVRWRFPTFCRGKDGPSLELVLDHRRKSDTYVLWIVGDDGFFLGNELRPTTLASVEIRNENNDVLGKKFCEEIEPLLRELLLELGRTRGKLRFQ